MGNDNTNNLISRRHFIGSIVAATTAGAFLKACTASSPWQIGIYTRPWNQWDYLVAFDSIAEAGFKYVGLMSQKGGRVIDQNTTDEKAAIIAEEAKSRGLEIISISGHRFEGEKPIDENVASLKKLIDNAVICNCPSLMLNGVSRPEYVDGYYKVIAEACDYAAEKGIFLNLKPHGGTNATGVQCRENIAKVGHKNFTLWYDPGNIYYYSNGEIDPVNDVTNVDGLVKGMCVKDFRMPKDVNVTPGTGMVDFPKLFERMRQGGFTGGPLVIECLNTGEIPYVTAEAKKALEFLEGILA
ncbi:TIM barrel protein [Maribellus comscasis]|uniref:TIM barrel protein n=1 Tax=Maribellus comscasis TaxID=2681766 RepID=A0A6I6JZC7_9BACT|nr:sugar phosphate isomerase/epimerase family protein [Maribellus comscasis]QGY44513.1 TIM barrel protein [Maribellus comscasis]